MSKNDPRSPDKIRYDHMMAMYELKTFEATPLMRIATAIGRTLIGIWLVLMIVIGVIWLAQ